MESGRITPLQLFLLGLPLINSTGILYLPGLLLRVAGRDAWLAMVLGTAAALVLVLVLAPLLRHWPRLSFVQVARQSLGRPVGGALGVFLGLWLLHLGVVVLRQFGDFVATYVLPLTPQVVTQFLLLLPATWVLRAGLEVLARAGTMIVSVNIIFIIVIQALTVKEADFSNLTPVLENGMLPVLRGALISSAWFGEMVCLAFLWPRLTEPRRGPVAIVGSTLLTGTVMASSVMLALGVFGVAAAHLVFPVVNVSRQVAIGGFLERIEPLLVIWMVGSIFVKLALILLVAILALGQGLGLREPRRLAYPVGALTLVLATTGFAGIPDLGNWLRRVSPLLAPWWQLGVPALAAAGGLILGRRRRRGRPA